MSPKTFIKDKRTYGFRYAIHQFYQRRHIPLVAFLVLAIATGYSFKLERDHSNQSRRELATQTRQVLYQSCLRGNQLRSTLQHIILNGIPQTRQYVKDGTITQAQANRSIKLSREAAVGVAPIDCVSLYLHPPHPSSSS